MIASREGARHASGLFDEIVVDCFAGGGGASTGIEAALGRSVDVAINHDREAVALHRVNHPHTRHYCEDIFAVDPIEATGGRPVGLAWFSPECKHFSKAKGGRPVSRRVRGLAWVVVRWARAVRPRMIMLENVEEFQTWGPLGADSRPCPRRKGRTFRRWLRSLEQLGYAVEWRELRACDYGAPTIRKRLFLVARCDGQPITWPEATHGRDRQVLQQHVVGGSDAGRNGHSNAHTRLRQEIACLCEVARGLPSSAVPESRCWTGGAGGDRVVPMSVPESRGGSGGTMSTTPVTIDEIRMFLLYPGPGGDVAHIATNGMASICGKWFFGAEEWDRTKRGTPGRICRQCRAELQRVGHEIIRPSAKLMPQDGNSAAAHRRETR